MTDTEAVPGTGLRDRLLAARILLPMHSAGLVYRTTPVVVVGAETPQPLNRRHATTDADAALRSIGRSCSKAPRGARSSLTPECGEQGATPSLGRP